MNRPAHGIISGAIDINILLGFVCGVAFLVTMLVFAVNFPNPEPFQLRVYITVLALAAGGFGAILPGKLDIKYKSGVRAGGALALVALVYLNQPAIEQHAVRYVPPAEPPEPVAATYLAALDAGDVDSMWRQLDPTAYGVSFKDKDQLKKLYDDFRKPMGTVVKRDPFGFGSAESPPGFPAGLYTTLGFRTKFSNLKGCRPESVTLRATQDKKWRVLQNNIGVTDIDC
ncbi:DUF4019 domain-containing protein [Bradyrhizobium sp. OK095]|uniref:DUF4019 domain-containing protein n=1 Tax=Bradyrhizobium sp. OK095 TaxID=1882760 RepID=UPI0008C958E4|nr:DUF4019 domain-containing protein [Bradyrhizobium sp. OK095]SEN01952.1 Protein of unknown function [Bradyrhizobium sp. OK095]